MIATKQMDVRANIKKYFDITFHSKTIIYYGRERCQMIWGKAAEMNFHGHRCRQGVLLAGHCLCRIRICG